jgi:SET domain-containing protein
MFTHFYTIMSLQGVLHGEQTLSIDTEEVCTKAIHPVTQQHALFALRSFSEGDIITPFTSSGVSDTPTYLTVQLGDDVHIELSPSVLQFTNHSCDPNCFFDTSRLELRALKNISKGDELTFFYPSTEWHMAQTFECLCGSERCIGLIEGAENLPAEILDRYILTEYISHKLSHR